MMDAKIRQYFVAVSDNSLKLPTLVDLLLAILSSNGRVSVAVCCSSRDSLDNVFRGLAASVPQAEVTYLHSDLSAEQISSALDGFAARLQLRNEAAAEVNSDELQPVSSSGSSPDLLHATLYGGSPAESSRLADSNAAVHNKEQHGKQALAQVLVMTDVLLRTLDAHQLPPQLALMIDFDLPLRKDLYAKQIQLLSACSERDGQGKQQIVIFFVVAGQIARFRALESVATGPIEVMPVHVSDIFSQRPH